MYIIELTYNKSLEEVESYYSDHMQWLEKYFKLDIFITSGRKVPRTGGVILCKTLDRHQLETILNEDPFIAVADYRITEFIANNTSDGFEILKHC